MYKYKMQILYNFLKFIFIDSNSDYYIITCILFYINKILIIIYIVLLFTIKVFIMCIICHI